MTFINSRKDQDSFCQLENLLDEIDCTHFSHSPSKLEIKQQNDKIVTIYKNDECLSFFVQPLIDSLDSAESEWLFEFDDLWEYLEYEFKYRGVKADKDKNSDSKN